MTAHDLLRFLRVGGVQFHRSDFAGASELR